MSRHYLRCASCRSVGTASELVACCATPDHRDAPMSKTEARARDRAALRAHFARHPMRRKDDLVPAWRRKLTVFLMWLRR